MTQRFNSIESVVADLRKGRMVIVVDDAGRENEGDLILAAQILADPGLRTIRLLTNNPRKIVGLEGYGLHVVEQVPIRVKPNPHNAHYLKTRREKLGHLL